MSALFTAAPPADLMLMAPIDAVAVWVTVGALGIPDYTRARYALTSFRFADTGLSA